MSLLIIIVLCIIIIWYFVHTKYVQPYKIRSDDISAILDGEAKDWKIQKIPHTEYVDITPLIDSCGKDITNSSRLLKDLYGPEISDKVIIFNKNDDLLYSHKWTSANVCKNITENDLIKNEYNYKVIQ